MAGTRILVAVDGSDHGNRAVDLAAELSAKLGHDLSIVHVLMHGRPPEELERLAGVEHLLDAVTPGLGQTGGILPGDFGRMMAAGEDQAHALRVVTALGEEILRRAADRAQDAGATGIRTHMEGGDAADTILDMAEAEAARMVIIGCRGLGRVRGLFLGSVSQKVVVHAPCTVVTVR